ncbi:natural resistance-associated macrophage protein [Polychaeton citri CBS 116435]|uniref:Natural resistance-associated macrophage protein n=1 Tax=Polychaeton citri CBS 116435 TaxID=1314669 RepID=A0A9P4UP67_9PEZI|nr:natural resistance-associated macrophage protein [Polychaeton citri CBS 116435]
MNCPSRTDTEPVVEDGYNQSPNALSRDLTTRSDMNGVANARLQRGHRIDDRNATDLALETLNSPNEQGHDDVIARVGKTDAVIDSSGGGGDFEQHDSHNKDGERSKTAALPTAGSRRNSNTSDKSSVHITHTHQHSGPNTGNSLPPWLQRTKNALTRFPKFIGPGFMISVAYIDPGNYATDVAAGASYRFRLLFVILVSNIFAIFLQSLCIKLGSVTGLNLSQMCRAHLPRWLNYTLYFFAESAIIATDIAEVIGTAIALKLLINVPLVAGCALSIVAVLVILFFYRPNSGSKTLRTFEFLIGLLVLGVVICFCFQLSLIENASVGEVFRGYLPSSAVVESRGLYQACGILGATVMPHSLFLGSGMVQPRLREFDESNNLIREDTPTDDEDDDPALAKYRPTLHAIRACLSYSIVELAIALFTFALFVNSAILIVAGASLYSVEGSDSADLFGIYHLLHNTLAPAAATVFALALLLSGVTAMIVCTIAGQIVCEGHLSLKLKPWVRALLTRSLSIVPAIVIAGAVGEDGLSRALEGSQVALSVILPFVSAPLLWFTCRSKYMTLSADRVVVRGTDGTLAIAHRSSSNADQTTVNMRNSWLTTTASLVIWLIIAIMNIALLVLAGLGIE